MLPVRLTRYLAALLGLHLTASLGLQAPRMSYLLGSSERPCLFYSNEGVKNTTTLLLSNDGSTLFVGAQDALLSLDVSQTDVITMKTKMEWKPSPADIKECMLKDKKMTDCSNFVRVLQPINVTHLYACGTFAYSPQDAYIDTHTLTLAKLPGKFSETKGRCPFSPYQRNTAISVDGELFTATTKDFLGKMPIISRHLSKDNRPDVTQDTSVTLDGVNKNDLHLPPPPPSNEPMSVTMFTQRTCVGFGNHVSPSTSGVTNSSPGGPPPYPTFVSSAYDPSEGKVYFFFCEVGNKISILEDFKVSRVAQVCKDDIGGQRILQKRWTSFSKAELLCRLPNELPFNVIQDVFTLAPSESTQDTFYYGIFTPQWSVASRKSAVCAFQLGDIKNVFAGKYKIFKNQQMTDRSDRNNNIGKCGLSNATDSTLMAVKESFLASGTVHPKGGVPVFISPDRRYSRVAVLRTQAASGQNYDVLFLLSDSGFIHKVVLLTKGPHIIEEIQVFRPPQRVKNILLSASKGVLFVGTSEGVTQMPVSQCQSYRSCTQCVLARDPFCGWDPSCGCCAQVSAIPANVRQDLEHGDVQKACQGLLKAKSLPAPVTVYTKLSEVVKLKCSRSSNLANINWKSQEASTLSVERFYRTTDDNLVFLATPNTLGTYHCISVEGGYEETAAIYAVKEHVSPQVVDTPPVQFQTSTAILENSEAEYHMTFTMEIPVDTEEELEPINVTENAVVTTEEATTSSRTSVTQTGMAKLEHTVIHREPQTTKSYHSELVAVSFLLVLCVCTVVLGGLYRWHQLDRCKLGLQDNPESGINAEKDPLECEPSLATNKIVPTCSE